MEFYPAASRGDNINVGLRAIQWQYSGNSAAIFASETQRIEPRRKKSVRAYRHACVGVGVVLILACGGDAPQPPDSPDAQPGDAPVDVPTPTPPPEAAAVPAPPPAEPILEVASIPSRVSDPEEAVSQLRAKLGDDDRDIREAAILALWEINTDASTQALADAAGGESEAELRSYILDELVDREATQAVQVASTLLQDADPDIREEAAEALETLEDKSAVPTLHTSLKTEQNEDVRDAIISALVELDPSFEEPE